jgi:hypothetical protein
MKKRIISTSLILLILISFLIGLAHFRQWINEDWINQFTIRKTWPIFSREIKKKAFSLHIPEGFRVYKHNDTSVVLMKYPIEKERGWCGNGSGINNLINPLKLRTNGITVIHGKKINHIDSLNSIVERDVKIGELCNMGSFDTIFLSGLKFYGRHGYIDENSKEEYNGEKNFGTYMNSENDLFLDFWGMTNKDIAGIFQFAIKEQK